MNNRLNYIQNWPELAQQSTWSTAALAKNIGVSVRTLERYFIRTLGKTPRAWMAEQRQLAAIGLLRSGASVKETAAQLAYSQATNFTRKFKSYYGNSPLKHLSGTNGRGDGTVVK